MFFTLALNLIILMIVLAVVVESYDLPLIYLMRVQSTAVRYYTEVGVMLEESGLLHYRLRFS